jgi:phthiocerol/phenolphthiocerol synthesis type-I polyketide synthase A
MSGPPGFATVCARDGLAAVAGLRALAAGQSAPGVVGPYQGAQPAPGTVFVYSGQGSQWPGMARQLMADEPVFAAAVAELEPDFVAQVGFSLQQVIDQGQSVSGDAQVQPVLMGLQLALTELWRSYGVYPDAVIGHSMGEVTAAVVAGALSPAEGLKVISLRSTLMSELAGQGGVGLVEMDAETAQELLAGYPGVEVAGYLSARQTVIAGPPEQVDAVIATVAADNRFARRVNMEVASHTALMDPVLDRLREALADLRAGTPTLPFISTVADTEGEVTLDADYWVANVRQPVRFHQAVTAAGAEHGTFVEVSPHPVLTAAIIETLGTDGHHVIATLSRDGDDTLNFHTNLNATHTAHPPETEHRPEPHQQLPTTPWHHEHFWAKARLRANGTGSAPRPGTLLGEHIAVAGTPPAHLWQARLVPAAKPYPGFHRFNGVELVPLSVLLHTLSVAAAECGAPKVSDVRFEYPIILDTPRVIQVFATEGSIAVSSSPAADAAAGKWVRHLTARLNHLPDDGATPGPDGVGGVQTDLDAETIEHRYREWGIEGHAFAWTVESCRTAPGELHAVISSPESATPVVLLDAAANVARMVDRDDPRLLVPTGVDGVRVAACETGGRGSIEVTRRSGEDFVLDIVARAPDGTELAVVTGLRYADMESGPVAVADPQSVAHILEWKPWDTGDVPAGAGSVAVVGNSEAAGALRDGLSAAGHTTAAVDDARFVVYVANPGTPGDDLDCAVAMTAEVGDLVRRLTDREPRNPGTLWILTAGVRDGDGDAALRQSPLWGIAGVIGAEQPQIWGALVDISAGQSMTDTAPVLAGVLAASAKSVLSLRDGRLFVSDLAALPGAPTREALRCRPDAAYLVTGGMGVLGLLTADWLADRGARRLVLAGRTPLPPRREWDSRESSDLSHRIAAIRALEQRGVSVETVALDIGSADAVAAWLARRDTDGDAPIRGIVHAAGMTEAQLVTDLEIPRIEQTMWPKVAGARVLHEAFPPGSVDFFYLTASAGAVFGIPGQGAYAAANAYLDCLARVRHQRGCQTVSLDWVAWQGLGFGADAEIVVDELARLGSRPVVPAEAFGAWELVSRYDVAQAVMIPQPASAGGPSAGDGDARGAAPARDWSQLAPEELRTELTNGLRTILAAELRLGEDEVDPDRPFAEMGLNSVMAMAIRREVEGLVGLELSATMLFNHPTMTSFVGYLARTLVPGDEPEEAADTADDSAGGVLDSLFDSVESAGTESRI